MDYEVSGLPMHVLLVHATVVFVPLAALCTLLSLLWPAARRRLGIVTPLIALLALVLVPITTAAGSWLLDRVDSTPQINAHMQLGGTLLPWVVGVFLVALAEWLWFRYGGTQGEGMRRRMGAVGSRIAGIAAVVVALVVCGGAVATVVLVGESGSRAVWEGSFRTGADD
ncbi:MULTISPECIES: DUF2231 domain-containing protein [Arthrobacter]|uniref:DUF2231 domain-containing protein n=1 Tax=Arthrobacter TaxID=1663 RepID=UPI000971A91A|nr:MULTISPECIES: DUF2231 domain-containing protein [Arthrobacter]APX04403.1 hypothetical protein BWQ92_08285 [Arthrobacter sp. QXT-31]